MEITLGKWKTDSDTCQSDRYRYYYKVAKRKQFTEQLRAALLNADETRYALSKATGITEGNLSRFVHGRAGLSMESIDLICDYLGLALMKTEKARTTRAKRKSR